MGTKLIKRKGNSRVSSFQDQLRAAGFNPGKSDGVWGTKTDRAWLRALAAGYVNLNGRLVKKNANPKLILIQALPQQAGLITSGNNNTSSTYTPWTPTLRRGQTYFENGKRIEDCARYANEALRQYKDKKGRSLYSNLEIGGDAWTRLSTGKHAKMVYSGYDGMDYDVSNEEDKKNYLLYLQAIENNDQRSAKTYRDLLQRSVKSRSILRNALAADNFYRNFDSNTLDKNKTYLVNMYYNDSPNMGVAWYGAKNGTTGTHTGNLYWNPDTNSWRISHNIHGTVHDDDFILAQGSRNRFGYGVTAIAEAPMTDYTRQDWDKAHPVKAAINKIINFGMWRKGGRLIPRGQGGLKSPGKPITMEHTTRRNGDWDYDVANPDGYDLSPLGITRTYQGQSTYGNSDSLPIAHSLSYISNRLPELANRYGLTVDEARSLLGDTQAVLWNESGGASRKKVDPKTGKVVENTLYNSKDNNPIYMFGVRSVNKLLGRGTSEGYGRVKVEDLRSLPNYSLKTEEELLNYPKRTPHFSGLSTYASMALRYAKLKEIFNEHPELIYNNKGELSELGHALLLTSHNQGFDNILKNYNRYLLNGNILELELYKTFRYPKLSLQLIKGHNISGSTPQLLPEVIVTPKNNR